MKVIFDMASVIQTGLRKGDCGETYEVVNPETGKVDKVNPWTHGYENAINYMVAKLDTLKCHPADAILVFEGKDSKKRRMQIMPTYKGQIGRAHV